MDSLLDYNDIAALMKKSMRHVRERVMKKPGAPVPVVPGRFKESDIKRFLDVLQCQMRRDCNTPSHSEGRASRTSGKDQEH